jgi:Phage P2 baseplate assembly protein gpV
MEKNLLSDTDYTSSRDNRFSVTAAVGRVSKIEVDKKGANVRVIMPDRIDHEDQPLISKPIPVLQIASNAKKSFAVPRLDDNVFLIKMPNGTGNYAVLGSFYTSKRPPPVTDPKLDYTEWEGGHTEKFDANDDADVFLTQDFKGGWKGTYKKDVNLNTTDSAKFNVQADGDILIQSANGNIDVKSPSGTVTIEQQTVELKATTIKLTGHVIVTGNIDETGVHLDNRGHHTNTAVLQERLTKLETLLAAAEERLAKLEARHGD